MTIALACRIEECVHSKAEGIPSTPLELFRSFRTLVQDGIKASVAEVV
jgi:hypothetical protein